MCAGGHPGDLAGSSTRALSSACQGRETHPPDGLTSLKNSDGLVCTESFRSTSSRLSTPGTYHSFILILTPRPVPFHSVRGRHCQRSAPPPVPDPRPLLCTLTRPQSQRLLPSLEVSASQLAGRRAGPRDGHPTATAPTRGDGDEAVSTTAPSPLWRAWRCVFSGFRSFLHGVKP